MQELFDELIHAQEEKVFALACKILPHVTRDDILQPNDFPELDNHPLFRHEEGVLEGLRTAKTAYIRGMKEREGEVKGW